MKWIRIGTISGDLAEKITQALETQGVINYRFVGPRLLDVYVEKPDRK